MNFACKSIVAIVGATLSLSACAKEATNAKTTPEPAAKASHNQEHVGPHDADSAAESTHFAVGMMKSYEQCRVLLAEDTSEGIRACASGIVEASQSSHASAPEAAHVHIGAVVRASKALAAMPLDDIEQVRLSFGELSKAIIAMLTSAPEAAKDYHVFECPMAKGYKRWAQPSAELANPYMGELMLTCGKEVHGHQQGRSESDGDAAAKVDLMAVEMAAYQSAKAVFDENCAMCHTIKPGKKASEAATHFSMSSYPFLGHHAADLGATIRISLGASGKAATMPKDAPGSLQGAELKLVLAWADAFDAAAAAGVGYHGEQAHAHKH